MNDFADHSDLDGPAEADALQQAGNHRSLARPAHAPFLRAAQQTDVGAVRERNEDSSLVLVSEAGGHFPVGPFGFFVVADGMGGHYGGHEASKAAIRAATSHIVRSIYLPLIHETFDLKPEQIAQQMETAAFAAHESVRDPDPQKNGGTTFTGALVLGRQLFIAHVGDSRAYWLVQQRLRPITRDHSLVQRLLDTGQISVAEAQDYQFKNVLLRALGQEDELVVDLFTFDLPPAGKLLLCSDGLCGMVPDAEIEAIMQTPQSPSAAAEALIAAALAAGGADNITAVVVDFAY